MACRLRPEHLNRHLERADSQLSCPADLWLAARLEGGRGLRHW
jgi:hypothetical protein